MPLNCSVKDHIYPIYESVSIYYISQVNVMRQYVRQIHHKRNKVDTVVVSLKLNFSSFKNMIINLMILN